MEYERVHELDRLGVASRREEESVPPLDSHERASRHRPQLDWKRLQGFRLGVRAFARVCVRSLAQTMGQGWVDRKRIARASPIPCDAA